ncbi:MAG: LTA synthase family protein, partial [Oscillospiraceae bacterium]|nr:LTA synthase family protein [Oscillospiraceae bacterium]
IIWVICFPFIHKKISGKITKYVSYIISGLLSICFIIVLSLQIANHSANHTFRGIYGLNNRGVCYNLVMNIKESFYAPPEGYSRKGAEEILARYTPEENDNHPNIIIIMNEAFADLDVYTDITPSEDPMPFIHSLNENVTKGYVVTPTVGGSTSNSEFEYLTGASMRFFPAGTFPYIQYIDGDTKTIIRDLDSDIYEKIYMHPYIASNYKRSSIFPFLGFDEFYDGLKVSGQKYYTEEIENVTGTVEYEGIDLIRGYIGDGVAYDKAIELFENKPEGKRTVQFIVTMQNHAPYTYEGDNFETTVSSGTGYDAIDQYLSLVKISDDEVKKLIEYFSEVEEDTVIVFFGDHKPAINSEIKLHNETIEYVPENSEFSDFLTPFFIWTNYESETEDAGFVSLNYLSLLTKKKAGVELTQFDMFRDEMYQKYPVFSSNIIIDSEGNLCDSTEVLDDEIVSEYEKLQYYYLFDK